MTPEQRDNSAASINGRAPSRRPALDEQLVEGLFDDTDMAGIDDKMKPLLRFARKLTEKPSSVTDADAQACYQAGWNEDALH